MSFSVRSAVLFGCVFIGTVVFSKTAFSLSISASDKRYFAFSLQSYSVRDAQDTKVTFLWNISGLIMPGQTMPGQKRLTVVPYSSNGRVVLYNSATESYVSSADLAEGYPYLEENMIMRVYGIKGSTIPYSLKFIIRDTYTGTIYETAEKKLWDFTFYEKYTQLLNKNLFESTLRAAEPDPPPQPPEVLAAADYKNPVKIRLWYLSPLFFLVGLLKLHNDPG